MSRCINLSNNFFLSIIVCFIAEAVGWVLMQISWEFSSFSIFSDLSVQVFDKEGSGKVPLPEVQNVLCSLGEKLDNAEAAKLCELLGVVAVSKVWSVQTTANMHIYIRVTESMVKSEFSAPRGRNVSISTTDDDSKIWWWSDKIYSWPPPNPFSHCKT